MTWHAVAAADDAVDATRRFLFPFGVVRWTKLALLVLLMGGGVNATVGFPPAPTVESPALPEGVPTDLPTVDAELLVAVGVVLAVAGALLSVASLSLRLVLYDALRTNEVRLWEPFKRRLRPAVGLFAFSLGLGLLLGGPFALAALAVERGAVEFAALPTAALVVGALAAVAYAAVMLLVWRFTFEFVVPVMALRDEGVVAAWRRFATTLRASWTQFVVYLLVHFFVALGVSIGESVVLLLVGGTAAVLAGVVLLFVAGALGGLGALASTTAGLVAVAVVVAVALGVLFVVLLPVRVLTRTYLVAYEVATLGGVDDDLRLFAAAIDPAGDGRDPARDDRDAGKDGRDPARDDRDAGTEGSGNGTADGDADDR